MNPITFFVAGIPMTAGSKRAFPLKKGGTFTGRYIMVDANPKAKDWKVTVAHAGEAAMAGVPTPFDHPLLEGPIGVSFTFHMPRIGSHYRANGELKPNAPMRPIVRPDVLKLSRAVEDALTGIMWRDDSQIVIEMLEKVYAEKPGCLITITPLYQPAPQAKPERTTELAL